MKVVLFNKWYQGNKLVMHHINHLSKCKIRDINVWNKTIVIKNVDKSLNEIRGLLAMTLNTETLKEEIDK